MINPQFNEQIKEIIKKSPSSYSTIIQHKKDLKFLKEYIFAETSSFDDLPFPTRIFYILNDITDYLKCKVCGKDIPHNRKCNALTGYTSLCCCPRCAQLDPEYILAVESRNLEKYGVRRPQMTENAKRAASIRASSKTNDEQNAINEKRKLTCLEKYGTESVSKLKSVKESISDTWKHKTQIEKNEITEKRKNAKYLKYGNPNFVNPEKTRKTISNNISQDKNFYLSGVESRKRKCFEKYGVEYAVQTKTARQNMLTARYAKQFETSVANCQTCTPLFTKEEFLANPKAELKWKCNTCGEIFSQKLFQNQLYPVRCLKCNPLNAPTSKAQSELITILKEFYKGSIINNTRNIIPPYELDIFIPEKKLAIEFDGLYWHSDDQIENNYHLNKTILCEKTGVQLIHVFENEWQSSKNIVIGRLKNLLGVYDKTIFARRCTVKELSNDAANLFIDANHLQHTCPASVKLGLFYDNQLISSMTFGKCRFDRKHEWEMLRFCNKIGYHIPGAAGKLLKYFEKTYKPKSLVTYADRRWSHGKLYRSLGFNLSHISKPNYWYWKFQNGYLCIFSRIKFQKHKLNRLLENFDPDKSEMQNMKDNKYKRIFNCGNYVFEKIY